MKTSNIIIFLVIFSSLSDSVLLAQTLSITEAQLTHGDLKQVGTGGAIADSTVITLQHASGWDYGENFFFIDFVRLNNNGTNPDNNPDNSGLNGALAYAEWYPGFSLNKMTNYDFSFGLVKDISIITGFNFAPEVDSWWFLPGVRLALDLPGFKFSNLDFTLFQHHSVGDINSQQFTIVDQENSWMIDFNWAYLFNNGNSNWSLTGHIEYINGRNQVSNFSTTRLESWVLFQPQLRFDIGKFMGGPAKRLYMGIEYQYWKNKLGEKGTDDNNIQLLAVWRF